jgi:hypothetical protein
MAITQNTLIGRASGSVGGATFATWKGKNVLKSKATSVANPNTAPQQLARSIFSSAVAVYRMAASLFSVGFAQLAVGQSAYNAFTSVNILDDAFDLASPGVIANKANFKASKGTLSPTPIVNISGDVSSNEVSIEWDGSPSGDQLTTDQLFVLVIKANGEKLISQEAVETRNSVTSIVSGATGMVVGQVYSAYMFFYQPSTRKVSNSVRATFTAVA